MYDWMVVDNSQLAVLSHAIVCNGPSWTCMSTQPHSLDIRCFAADSPVTLTPLLCYSNWKTPLTSMRKSPLAGRSWSWILLHWPSGWPLWRFQWKYWFPLGAITGPLILVWRHLHKTPPCTFLPPSLVRHEWRSRPQLWLISRDVLWFPLTHWRV